MGIPGVNLVVNPNPCLEKPALRESNMIENKLQYVTMCNGDVDLFESFSLNENIILFYNVIQYLRCE